MKKNLFVLLILCPIISFGQNTDAEIFNPKLDSILSISWKVDTSYLYNNIGLIPNVYYNVSNCPSSNLKHLKIIKNYRKEKFLTEISVIVDEYNDKFYVKYVYTVSSNGEIYRYIPNETEKIKWVSPVPKSLGYKYLELVKNY